MHKLLYDFVRLYVKIHRGSYMSAHVLLNVSNELGKSDIIRGFVIFQGIGTSIAKGPYFCAFTGGHDPLPPPPPNPK